MTEYVYVTKGEIPWGGAVRRYRLVKRTPKTVVAEGGQEPRPWRRTFGPDECFDTHEAAKAEAIRQRDVLIAERESEIARLKAMTFDTVREG